MLVYIPYMDPMPLALRGRCPLPSPLEVTALARSSKTAALVLKRCSLRSDFHEKISSQHQQVPKFLAKKNMV